MNIEKLEKNVKSLYEKFKTDEQLHEHLNEYRAVVDKDEKRDEVYRSKESYYDVSMKGKYIEEHGDVLYGLRIRLQNKNGLEVIKSTLSEYNYNPNKVITDVSEKFNKIEITIELTDISKLNT